MAAETPTLAICFADICDSTRLFEMKGDDRARDIVARVLNTLGDVIEDYDGRVVKTIGDEVMGAFPELLAAMSAVTQFPEKIDQDDELSQLGIQIRVGMCYGTVLLEEDGDVYGDAVNTASRLVDWARPDQIVTTADVLDELPGFVQDRTRSLGSVTLRGKENPVEVIELLGQQVSSDLTVVGGRPDPQHEKTRSHLEVTYGDETRTLEDQTLVLGRGSKSDLVVADSRASRVHAKIESQNSAFVLVDSSTNGTYVQVGNEDVLYLHRDQLRLHGSGRISLGRQLDHDKAQIITFACHTGSNATSESAPQQTETSGSTGNHEEGSTEQGGSTEQSGSTGQGEPSEAG